MTEIIHLRGPILAGPDDVRDEVDVVLGVPALRLHREFFDGLFPGHVFLGERGTLVGEPFFGAEQHHLSVKTLAAQGFRGFGARQPAADDHKSG